MVGFGGFRVSSSSGRPTGSGLWPARWQAPAGPGRPTLRCRGSAVRGPPFWRRNRAPRTRAFWSRFSFRRSAPTLPLPTPRHAGRVGRRRRRRAGTALLRKSLQRGAYSNVARSIRPHLRGCSRCAHVGSGAGADPDARDARAGSVNVLQSRRRLQVDNEAMEPGKGQMGQGKRKVGRLPEAIEGSKARRPKELVIPCVLHDQLMTG